MRPGGHLALLWGDGPADGHEPWQQTLKVVMQRWQHRNGADQRIPPGYSAARRDRPDAEVLSAAGFDLTGTVGASVGRAWTLDEIRGFLAATSVLSPIALGDRAGQFDADLRESLRSCQPDGRFWQDVTFKCELARVSPPGSTG